MHGDALDVLELGGAQKEAGDGAGQAEGAHDLPHGFLAGRGDGGPQGVSVGTRDGLGDLQEVETVTHEVNNLAGQFRGAVVSAGDDGRVHAPVVGDDVLEVVVGDQEDLEFTVGHGQRDERQIAKVPPLLLSGQLSEKRAVIIGELEVAQIHALKGSEERHGRGGGAADLDDASRGGVHDLGHFVVGGPDLAQRGVALGQVVGGRVADAHLGVEQNGELVGQLRGGGAGNNLGRAGGDGGDALVVDRDIQAKQLRRGGEPLDLGEDRTLLQLAGDHAGIQIVADDHAFNASPFLGHVATFLSVVRTSHHSMVPLCRVGRYFARPRGQLRDFVSLHPGVVRQRCACRDHHGPRGLGPQHIILSVSDARHWVVLAAVHSAVTSSYGAQTAGFKRHCALNGRDKGGTRRHTSTGLSPSSYAAILTRYAALRTRGPHPSRESSYHASPQHRSDRRRRHYTFPPIPVGELRLRIAGRN